jgi:ATP-dependent helicase/DNAse subunit B
LLDHPYLFKILKSEDIFRLKNYILNNNLSFISPEIIVSTIGDSCNDIFENWSNTNDLINGLDTVVNLMRKKLIDKNATLDSEILNVFYKILRKFEVLINDFNFNIDLKSAYSIFQQLVAKEIIPFKGEPLEGVQVMGILESRTLDFKNIIILGVNEGFLPQGKSVNSFIPFDLKIYFKMPTFNERDAVFSYHFYRLLQRANNITLTYNTQNDDFGSGEKSRFITQLVNEYKSNPISLLEYQNSDFKNNELFNPVITNANLDEELKAWAINGVSTSAISKYINCNLDFYFHYLLKIREDKKINEFADNSLMGDAIHEGLSLNYPTGNIDVNNYKSISNKVKDSIDVYYQSKLPNENYKRGKNLLSLSLAKKLIDDFSVMELDNIKQNKFINILFKEIDFDYTIKVDNLICNLIGKIDRVDICDDVLRVIDYKTGKAVTKKDLYFHSWQDLFENSDKKFLLQIFMYVFLFLQKNPKYI